MAFTIPRSPISDRFLLILLISIVLLYILFAQLDTLPRWGTLHRPNANSGVSFGTPFANTDVLLSQATDVNWSRFAYSTYATSRSDLCNALMLLEALHRLDVRADRLLLHNREWNVDTESEQIGRLLTKARDEYNATLKPLEILRADSVSDTTWQLGFTKLLSFNQTEYERVLMMDADATILKSMDELFLLPSAAIAMPRAYWLDHTLSDQMFLVQPSSADVQEILGQMKTRKPDEFDMEVLNNLYRDRCIILPHRPYNLLSGEFRSKSHEKYLTNYGEKWDARAVLDEAKFVHFSDWPLPKPWLPHAESEMQKVQPSCDQADGTYVGDCEERKIWRWLYEDFRSRREVSE